MTDFDTVRFPPKISMGAVGGPRFKTSLAVMASGAESRTQEWELSRGEWTVSFSARRPQDWEPLLSFFYVIPAGMANSFRFKDWTDFICLQGSGFFVPAQFGSPTGHQMVKRYSYGGFTFDRRVVKPVNGTITVTGGGTLDYSTGIIQGGNPTAWYGEFDCQCRLNNDAMKTQVIDRNVELGLLVGWENIEIVELTNEID